MELAPGMAEFIEKTDDAMPLDFYKRPLTEARQLYENLAVVFPYEVPASVTVTDETLDHDGHPVKIRVYRPAERTGRGLVLYLRGGGFVIGSLNTHHTPVAELAANAGLTTVAVDFRMAPEHPFPAGLEDCYAALCAVVDQADRFDIDPTRIVVAGCSSGANMAVVLCMMTRDRGGPPLWGQALISPVLDFSRWRDGGEDVPLLTGGEMEFFTACYCPNPEHVVHPYVSPLISGEFHGLPPAYIMGAEFDSLLVDAQKYAELLRDNGTPVEMVCELGLAHASIRARGYSPRAAEMWKNFCSQVQRLANGA